MKVKPEVEFLKKFVEIPSVTGHEKEVAAFLVQETSKLGFTSKIDAVGNFIGEIGKGKRTMVLLGHIDTVPGVIPVQIKGGKLYGRGSVDAKGPMATFIWAAAKAKPKDLKIQVIGAVEEEGSSKGAHFVKNKIKPDLIVIGEPSSAGKLTIGYKGTLRFWYTLKKSITHGASNETNAYDDAITFYNELKEYTQAYNVGKGTFEQLLVYPSAIETKGDGLHQEICFKIVFRVPVELTIDDVLSFAQSKKESGRISEVYFEKPIKASKNTPLVRAFLQAIRAKKLEPKFSLKTGTSDMNVLGNHFTVPIVTYGPGNSMLDHTPDEHIEIEEYVLAIEILKDVLENI